MNKIEKSKKRMVIKKVDRGGKEWIEVKFTTSDVWMPSFIDLARILFAIGWCEDRKYPHGKGRDMVTEFVIDRMGSKAKKIDGMSLEELVIKYDLIEG